MWESWLYFELLIYYFFYYCFTVLFYTCRWWIIVSKWNIFWRFYSPAGLGYFQGKLWINAFNFSIINCCGQKWWKVPVTLFPGHGNITNWFRRARYLSVRSGSDAGLCISWTYYIELLYYMKGPVSESIRNAYIFNLEQLSWSSRLAWPGILTMERLWKGFDSDAELFMFRT